MSIEFPSNAILSRIGPPDESVNTPDEWLTTAEDTEATNRLYRTKASLIDLSGNFKFMTIRVDSNVPLKSGAKTIGCVTGITVDGETVVADLTLDYATPERLEIELRQLYADGYFMVTSTKDGYITSATLKEVNLLKQSHHNMPPVGQ